MLCRVPVDGTDLEERERRERERENPQRGERLAAGRDRLYLETGRAKLTGEAAGAHSGLNLPGWVEGGLPHCAAREPLGSPGCSRMLLQCLSSETAGDPRQGTGLGRGQGSSRT